jgi:hypothetical protein
MLDINSVPTGLRVLTLWDFEMAHYSFRSGRWLWAESKLKERVINLVGRVEGKLCCCDRLQATPFFVRARLAACIRKAVGGANGCCSCK